ncbi:hypothetical protein MTR_7g033010 [Medicago truncatula]|uniref:Uncharacterized protein n=1 Tax=Medicago truncatula TaxID=3880 RepID=G7L6A0_MEDTR|nr:hypothetical protein MTR_7g033010 [Medicago truncatula]
MEQQRNNSMNEEEYKKPKVYDESTLLTDHQLANQFKGLLRKRGLSKCYDGKSKSFYSLANLRSDEDLGKNPTKKKLKYKHNDEGSMSP